MKLIFMLEELSAKEFLDILLPRILPKEVSFLTIPHDGKTDLEGSIPRKLKAWREPDVHFVIVRDKDSADCKRVKEHLTELCTRAGRPDALVRIVCHELEAWFLGDPAALAEAFEEPVLAAIAGKQRFRNPDLLGNPAQELKKLIPQYQKVSGARRMGASLRPDRCSSHSFQVFLTGLERFCAISHTGVPPEEPAST